MFLCQFAVDDGGDRRGQQAQRQIAADLSGPAQLKLVVVDHRELLIDIFWRPAKFTQNKEGALLSFTARVNEKTTSCAVTG